MRPVGGDDERAFDVRIVAATNRDLETEMDERRFREDLYYRINVMRIDVPALRARDDDVLLLAHHFVKQTAAAAREGVVGISTAAAQKLLAYAGRATFASCSNCIERAVALTRFEELTVDDLPEQIRTTGARRWRWTSTIQGRCRRWPRSSGATSCA